MNHKSLVGVLTALTLSLLIPAAVSAEPAPTFGARILKAACTNYKGNHGFGKVVLMMSAWGRNDVVGAPTPNYSRISGRYEQKIDGVWVKGGVSTTTTPIYPDGTGAIYPNLHGMAWHFESADHPLTRMVMKVEFFDVLPTGEVRLGKISARTAAC